MFSTHTVEEAMETKVKSDCDEVPSPFWRTPKDGTIPRNNPPRQPAHVSDLGRGNIRELERERERGGVMVMRSFIV